MSLKVDALVLRAVEPSKIVADPHRCNLPLPRKFSRLHTCLKGVAMFCFVGVIWFIQATASLVTCFLVITSTRTLKYLFLRCRIVFMF